MVFPFDLLDIIAQPLLLINLKNYCVNQTINIKTDIICPAYHTLLLESTPTTVQILITIMGPLFDFPVTVFVLYK